MEEQQKLYSIYPIHESSCGLCGKCQKILWLDCHKRYARETAIGLDGHKETINCNGFEPVIITINN